MIAPIRWALGLAAFALVLRAALPAAAQEKPPEKPASSATPAPPPPPAAPPVDAEAKAAPDPANKEPAKQHFEKGLKLLAEDAWQAALAEFLQSRELYPTRAATTNAGVALKKLQRFDEALDTYEAVLREFPDMPPKEKQAAREAVAELRERVGTIDVAGSVPGAAIVIDGKTRADYPLIDPLRVAAGSHAVRVFKEGFEPFESRVEVAGGQTLKVVATLRPLQASGRLRVAEASGQKLDVVVDGAVVGVTPWEGVLSVGDRVVLLRGDEDFGTEPALARVKNGETANLTLAATRLESGVGVQVVPAGASIAIDSVPVGSGVWDGRLRLGKHKVEARMEGFFPRAQELTLDRGERESVKLVLERDEDSSKWRKPPKVRVDSAAGVGLSPSFGGDVAGGCEGDCSRSLGVGAVGTLHATYELGSGLGFGLAVGYLHVVQNVTDRPATLQATGLAPSPGSSQESLRIGGFLLGAAASQRIELGPKLPGLLRLGAGALIGSVRNVRGGRFMTRAGTETEVPDVEGSPKAAFVYIDPEVRLGYEISKSFDVGVGVEAMFLVALSKPRWGAEQDPALLIPGDGYATYPDEALVGDLVVVFTPGVTARYTF